MPTDERIHELRAWARSRIEQCRRDEDKFARVSNPRRGPAQALIEASQERRTLQAVLNIIGNHRESADAD